MKLVERRTAQILCLLLLATGITRAQEQDVAGSKDHPLFSRMSGYYIQDYEKNDFDRMDFMDEQGRDIQVEGTMYYISYYIRSGVQAPNEVQVLRNYSNAIQKIGGTIVYEADYDIYLKLEKSGTTIWVHVRVWNDGEGCDLYITEKKQMVQEIIADAKSMANDINTNGRVAVYGIYFDFSKADIKSESVSVLKEIAKLLQQNPKIYLYIVGHTDNVGTLSANADLSKRRAEAVVNALVSSYGVNAKRLHPAGVGQLSPVASNKTDEGRAKNRRVELVEQ